MSESLQISIFFLLGIFFLVYIVLSFVYNWKKGWKKIGEGLLQAPLRLLLAMGAIYGIVTENTLLAICSVSALFLVVYLTSKKHKEEIQQAKEQVINPQATDAQQQKSGRQGHS